MSTQPLLQRTAQKRIALPIRVEPKVFFANERTFLSWLNFSVVLGGLAVGLLNFGDRVGRISAGLFSFVGACNSCPVIPPTPVGQIAHHRFWGGLERGYTRIYAD
jgi:hypothetical protein